MGGLFPRISPSDRGIPSDAMEKAILARRAELSGADGAVQIAQRDLSIALRKEAKLAEYVVIHPVQILVDVEKNLVVPDGFHDGAPKTFMEKTHAIVSPNG